MYLLNHLPTVGGASGAGYRGFLCLLGLSLFVAVTNVSCTSQEATPAVEQEATTRAILLDREAEATSIRGLLEQQQVDWNNGNIEAFMEGYWKSPELRFASGGEVRRGWDTTLERYHQTYPDRAAMGELQFSNLEIDVVSRDTALVFGGWRLVRENDAPSGLYTLLLRKLEQDGTVAWRIAADHTSSSD